MGIIYGRIRDGKHRWLWNPDYYPMNPRKCDPGESMDGSVSVNLPFSGQSPGPSNPYLWGDDEGFFTREHLVSAVKSVWVAVQYWECDPEATGEAVKTHWVRTAYTRAIIRGERSYGVNWDTGERLAISEDKKVRVPLKKPVVISVPEEGDDLGLEVVPSNAGSDSPGP
jgi:hypothetical protein